MSRGGYYKHLCTKHDVTQYGTAIEEAIIQKTIDDGNENSSSGSSEED